MVQGWTLEYEMAFYGLFALALVTGQVSAVLTLMGACFVAGLCAFAGVSGSGLYGSSSLLAEFSFGMAIAFYRPQALRASTAIGAVLFGILMFAGAEVFLTNPAAWRLIVWGVPATLVVAGCSLIPNGIMLSADHTSGRVWLLLGDASYTIYLFHVLIFKIVGRPFLGLVGQGTMGLWAYFAIISTAAIGLGVGVHIVVERPVQARLRRSRRRMGNRSVRAETTSV